MLSKRFNASLLEVTEVWTYNELQTALDLLDALEAAESRAGES